MAYLNKLMGKFVAELGALNLREKTLSLFSIDNGTACLSMTRGGRKIHGAKGSLWEGGIRVPLIANWKGATPQGRVLKDLVDFTDMYVTFAEPAGAKPPENPTLDSHSLAPQFQGQPGTPREWIFVQIGANGYLRDNRCKLNQAGELYNLKDAPFEEAAVAADSSDPDSPAARRRLQGILENLAPRRGKREPPSVRAVKKKNHEK